MEPRTIGELKQIIKDLPDTAEIVIWVPEDEDGEVQAVPINSVEVNTSTPSLHFYVG